MITNIEEGDLLLRVAGIIPPDEFHPFVVRIARRLGLRGWVRHDSAGALIRAVGSEEQLVMLVRAIREDGPPSLRVRGMDPEAITVHTPAAGDRFVPLVAADTDMHDPSPEHPSPLERVA